MKTNKALGYAEVVSVGNYDVGQRGNTYRAYGYEWDSHQDASPRIMKCVDAAQRRKRRLMP